MTGREVIDRINTMRRTPLMWAVTREGFFMQIAMMISIVYGLDVRKWERSLIKMPIELADSLDESFAIKICDSALDLIEKSSRLPSP